MNAYILLVVVMASFKLVSTQWEEKIIDLGHPFNSKSNYWPNSETGFHLRYFLRGVRPAGYWYQAEEISEPVHGGTHMDAPLHFAAGKWSIDKIPVENFIAPGSVIDVRNNAQDKPDYQLTKKDITDWEDKHGSIGNTIVLINFGWAKHYSNRSYYFAGPSGSLGPHGNDTSDLHFPGIHPDAARYFADKQPKVLGVGLDTPSLDYGQGQDFMTHRTLFSKNIFGMENVVNMEKLPPKVDEIIVLPMNIQGSGGAPIRILARIQKADTSSANHVRWSSISVLVSFLWCLV